MNSLSKHSWVFLFFLSLGYVLHLASVYSAPIKLSDDLAENVASDLNIDMNMDEKMFDQQGTYGPNIDPVPIFRKNLWLKNFENSSEDRDVLLDKIYFSKVMPKRPLLGEIIVFGCLSILLALTGGAIMWVSLYSHMKQEDNGKKSRGNHEEIKSFPEILKPSQSPIDTRWEVRDSSGMESEKERHFKALLHSVLKIERKKKRRKRRRRSDPKLDITRKTILAQKKQSGSLEINMEDTRFFKLNGQMYYFRKSVEETTQDTEWDNQIQLIGFPDVIPTNTVNL